MPPHRALSPPPAIGAASAGPAVAAMSAASAGHAAAVIDVDGLLVVAGSDVDCLLVVADDAQRQFLQDGLVLLLGQAVFQNKVKAVVVDESHGVNPDYAYYSISGDC